MSYTNLADNATETTAFNRISFMIKRVLEGTATMQPALVKACTSGGTIAAPGTVSIQPMVHQVTGAGIAQPHGIIYGVPFWRLTSGNTAVILDPQPNDIGIAIVATRDISLVKQNKAPALPASLRQFDWADAIYIGSILGGIPTNFIQMTNGQINVTATTSATVTAPTINLNGTLIINGTPFLNYKATGVQSGSDEGTGLSAT